MASLPLDLKIDRAQRLLEMIEQDAPLLAARVAPLSAECQESAKSHAATLAAMARAELKRLKEERELAEIVGLSPEGAD